MIKDKDKKFGFLFDVDGCITPKNSKEIHARVDPVLLPWFEKIRNEKHAIAFITGRSYAFMLETVPIIIDNDYLCFFEYGWCVRYTNKTYGVNMKAKSWRETILKDLFNVITEVSNSLGFPFSDKEHILAPENGSMWIESKETMVSIASNTLVSNLDVHKIMELVIPKIFTDKENIPKINYHHLGLDIMMPDTSKKFGAIKARDILDPNDEVSRWFVFGDSYYDEEMCLAFEKDKSYFVNTKKNASEDVLKKLNELF